MENSNLSILDNEELLNLTRWQLDQGQFGDALISVKHALLRDDKSMECYRLGAKIYAQLGLLDQAKKAFEAFLEHEPEALTEAFQYGMVHYDNGENEKAIEIWRDILEKEATYPPALFYSALAQANSKQPAKAIEHLNVLIKSAPSDNLYFERGRELIQAIEQNQSNTQDNAKPLEKYTADDDRTIN